MFGYQHFLSQFRSTQPTGYYDNLSIRYGIMCALRNAVISLLRTSGYAEIAYSRRYFAAHPEQALKFIGRDTEN